MTPNPLIGHKLGLGTWQMGESRSEESIEIKAVTHALEIGYRLIDTAEMYASGGAERVVGKAIRSFGAARRRELTLVSKVLPSNASYQKTIKVCHEIIGRMDCDYLDVFLLHWQGNYPYEETLNAFIELRDRGLIRSWGVSNFDSAELKTWLDCEKALGVHKQCVTNQVYYALCARGIEFDLKPWMLAQGMPVMAYSPLGTGELARNTRLKELGERLGISAAQLALAWLLQKTGVVAIPKSSDLRRLEQNFVASKIVLSAEILEMLDRLYEPPKRKQPLAMI